MRSNKIAAALQRQSQTPGTSNQPGVSTTRPYRYFQFPSPPFVAMIANRPDLQYIPEILFARGTEVLIQTVRLSGFLMKRASSSHFIKSPTVDCQSSR
jgi:hypothetical protein